jgi:peroxiredoxin
MKRLLPLLFLIPAFSNAQVKKKKVQTIKFTPPLIKPNTKYKEAAHKVDDKLSDLFKINGTVQGVVDGTILKLLNGSTGAEEKSATVKAGKFYFEGTITNPDFKVIGINGQPPFITIYIDKSIVDVKAKNGEFEKAIITGSTSHDDFTEFNNNTAKYQDLFTGKGNYPVEFLDEAGTTIEKFVASHKNAFISPLAIYRHSQITGDYVKQEEMYNTLTNVVKNSTIGQYIATQIADTKKAGYGKPLASFSQADTSGKEISLEAFKGKYVLVDFWASWCGPCRAENPNVVRNFEKYKSKNFTVLGISLDKDKQKWIDAIAADGLNWTQLSDLKFWNNAVAQQFGIQSIPQNFLLDPQGNLIGKNLRGSALEYKLMKAIK